MSGFVTGGGGIAPGTTALFAMATPPVGWLKCNGAAVSRVAYAALFTAIGTTYGAGDGSTTFNLPDDRGLFHRCWDDGAGVDAGRALGSYQADAYKAHTHVYNLPTAANVGTSGNQINAGGLQTVNTTSVGDTETRGKNRAYLSCIKF
ncbi:MAG: phage tail protein [Bacteroidales bacterium]